MTFPHSLHTHGIFLISTLPLLIGGWIPQERVFRAPFSDVCGLILHLSPGCSHQHQMLIWQPVTADPTPKLQNLVYSHTPLNMPDPVNITEFARGQEAKDCQSLNPSLPYRSTKLDKLIIAEISIHASSFSITSISCWYLFSPCDRQIEGRVQRKAEVKNAFLHFWGSLWLLFRFKSQKKQDRSGSILKLILQFPDVVKKNNTPGVIYMKDDFDLKIVKWYGHGQ